MGSFTCPANSKVSYTNYGNIKCMGFENLTVKEEIPEASGKSIKKRKRIEEYASFMPHKLMNLNKIW
jgi:hypothetical protein